MRIGILSDTHNQLPALLQALEIFRRENIATLFHCGDMTAPDTAQTLAGFRVIHVLGNGDFASGEIAQTLRALDPENFSGPVYTGCWDGVHIAALHGHDLAMLYGLIESGRYDYVFRGHSHRRKDERAGRTRILNPGALGGLQVEDRSVCVLDLSSGAAEFIRL